MIESLDDYDCVEGYSNNWVSENRNERGNGVGQVLYGEGGTQINQIMCRNKCENLKAAAYNWIQWNNVHGCRCYSHAAANNLSLEGNNWLFCKRKGKIN